MTTWLPAPAGLSVSARRYREAWAGVWPGWSADPAQPPPPILRERHLALPKDFRTPLGHDEELTARVEYHRAVLAGLASPGPVVLVTVDWEWAAGPGERRRQRSADLLAVADLPAEAWLSVAAGSGAAVITTVGRTRLAPDDPRLVVALTGAAQGVPLLVTDEAVSWIARPHEDCVGVLTRRGGPSAVAVAEALSGAQQQVRARWGLDDPRVPLIDLTALTEDVARRRSAWAQRGVRIVTGPQYRTWPGPTIVVVDELPSDPAAADWLHLELAAAHASALVTVHDTGTCSVRIDLDPDGRSPGREQLVVERRRPAGAQDQAGVLATLERVVDTLTGPARSG